MNLLALSLALLSTVASPNVEVQTLAGEQSSGQLVSLDAEQLVVEAPEGPRSFAVQNLLAVRPLEQAAAVPQLANPESSATILLTDGSTLRVQDYRVEGETAHFVLAEHALTLPVAAIRTVRFGGGPSSHASQWEQITTRKAAGDLLVVYRTDSLDYLEGIIGAVTDERVQFQLDGDTLPVRKNKIAGLVYYRPNPPGGGTGKCLVVLANESRLAVTSLVSSGETIELKTGAGMQLTLPWSAVRRLDFGQGKVQYLTELTPQSTTWEGYFGTGTGTDIVTQFYQPRSDQGFNGQPLRLRGETYARGLAIHSRTELIYRLPGQFRRFVAVAGIDDVVTPHGDVHLTIWGDNRLLFEQQIRGGDDPLSLDLDISGASRLRILVDYGEHLDVADHLNLCEARVLK